eukprot:m.68809 g.68809  ORF g.68809 m.68809 type:complete len:64 (+) comp13700_c0_seq1:328-519(+)
MCHSQMTGYIIEHTEDACPSRCCGEDSRHFWALRPTITDCTAALKRTSAPADSAFSISFTRMA